MNEFPILFTGEMVRAILDGRKCQTRRIVKPQPPTRYDRLFWESGGTYGWWHSPSTSGQGAEQQDLLSFPKSPFGTIGDRLWVREAFRIYRSSVECACYDDCRCSSMDGKPLYRASDPSPDEDKWTPSIHMPRWASRIDLEIIAVRVERVQDISHEDAIAEGCVGAGWKVSDNAHPVVYPAIEFSNLWQSIHGTWDGNPWVWVYEFRRIKP